MNITATATLTTAVPAITLRPSPPNVADRVTVDTGDEKIVVDEVRCHADGRVELFGWPADVEPSSRRRRHEVHSGGEPVEVVTSLSEAAKFFDLLQGDPTHFEFVAAFDAGETCLAVTNPEGNTTLRVQVLAGAKPAAPPVSGLAALSGVINGVLVTIEAEVHPDPDVTVPDPGPSAAELAAHASESEGGDPA